MKTTINEQVTEAVREVCMNGVGDIGATLAMCVVAHADALRAELQAAHAYLDTLNVPRLNDEAPEPRPGESYPTMTLEERIRYAMHHALVAERAKWEAGE